MDERNGRRFLLDCRAASQLLEDLALGPLDGGHDTRPPSLWGSLGGHVDDELKQLVHSLGGESGAFGVSDCSGPLDEIHDLLLAAQAALSVLAGAGPSGAHGVALAANEVEWRSGAVFVQLREPLGLDAVEAALLCQVEAQDDRVAAFVGELADHAVGRARCIEEGEMAALFLSQDFGREVVEAGRLVPLVEEPLGEPQGESGLPTAVVSHQDHLLLARIAHFSKFAKEDLLVLFACLADSY